MILLTCRDPQRQSIPGEARPRPPRATTGPFDDGLQRAPNRRRSGRNCIEIRMLMNGTIELLRRRRSLPPQGMIGPGPNAQEIDTLLRLASRVPDHRKLAPWRLLVLEDDARAKDAAI